MKCAFQDKNVRIGALRLTCISLSGANALDTCSYSLSGDSCMTKVDFQALFEITFKYVKYNNQVMRIEQ